MVFSSCFQVVIGGNMPGFGAVPDEKLRETPKCGCDPRPAVRVRGAAERADGVAVRANVRTLPRASSHVDLLRFAAIGARSLSRIRVLLLTAIQLFHEQGLRRDDPVRLVFLQSTERCCGQVGIAPTSVFFCHGDDLPPTRLIFQDFDDLLSEGTDRRVLVATQRIPVWS